MNQVHQFLQNITSHFILSYISLQPLQTFSHPTFKNMVDIASWATCEVSLPSPKQSRVCILQMFKEQLRSLRVCLLVRFSLSYIDFHLLTNCCGVAGYMLEPHCQGWSQPHLWRVAGQQLQCILCSDWPLDWGACGWQVDHRDCTNWVCPNEHGS